MHSSSDKYVKMNHSSLSFSVLFSFKVDFPPWIQINVCSMPFTLDQFSGWLETLTTMPRTPNVHSVRIQAKQSKPNAIVNVYSTGSILCVYVHVSLCVWVCVWGKTNGSTLNLQHARNVKFAPLKPKYVTGRFFKWKTLRTPTKTTNKILSNAFALTGWTQRGPQHEINTQTNVVDFLQTQTAKTGAAEILLH